MRRTNGHNGMAPRATVVTYVRSAWSASAITYRGCAHYFSCKTGRALHVLRKLGQNASRPTSGWNAGHFTPNRDCPDQIRTVGQSVFVVISVPYNSCSFFFLPVVQKFIVFPRLMPVLNVSACPHPTLTPHHSPDPYPLKLCNPNTRPYEAIKVIIQQMYN